jgi:hypothetical protein
MRNLADVGAKGRTRFSEPEGFSKLIERLDEHMEKIVAPA